MRIIFDEELGESRLTFFQNLKQKAYNASSSMYENMERHYEQYRGSPMIDRLPGNDAADAPALASVVRNITYELIESQITTYIPNPQVTPKSSSDISERLAKSIESLLKNMRDRLPCEKMNDIDERYNPIYGGSVWLVEWDNSVKTHTTVGDIKLSCVPPKRFIGQPAIYEIDDMEYCFISFEATKDDIMRKYDVTLPEAKETESEEENGELSSTATVWICYYKNDDNKVCQYIWSGDVELADIDDYYSRKIEYCTLCGMKKELCTCKEKEEKPEYIRENDDFEELQHDIITENASIPALSSVIENGVVKTELQMVPQYENDGSPAFDMGADGMAHQIEFPVEMPVLEKTKLPYYTPSKFPIVIRKNTSQEDSLFGQSDCEFIRPQQQLINKLQSRMAEKIFHSGVYPILPEGLKFTFDQSIGEKVLVIKPEHKGAIDVLDTQVDVTRDEHHERLVYEDAKRILGISDSFLGQHDSSATSGVAKQMMIQQSAGRLDSKRQMKNAAWAEIDEVAFQLYLAYADEPREVFYTDELGRRQNVEFNRYDFIKRDEYTGDYYYDDRFMFKTDYSVDAERSRQALWEMNIKNLAAGVYGDPALPETRLMYWLMQEKAHYPNASDMVSALKAEIERMRQLQMMQTGGAGGMGGAGSAGGMGGAGSAGVVGGAGSAVADNNNFTGGNLNGEDI